LATGGTASCNGIGERFAVVVNGNSLMELFLVPKIKKIKREWSFLSQLRINPVHVVIISKVINYLPFLSQPNQCCLWNWVYPFIWARILYMSYFLTIEKHFIWHWGPSFWCF
jgi:hypothetical protein